MLPIDDQIELWLDGDYYKWAVDTGLIRHGEPLELSKIFSLTKSDFRNYFSRKPVPGIDVDASSYRQATDGFRWKFENGKYFIGDYERGVFTLDSVANSPEEFRTKWIDFLVRTTGFPD